MFRAQSLRFMPCPPRASHAGRWHPAAPSRRGVPRLPQDHRPPDTPDLDLHLILDNYATHKAPPVQRWLKRHSRFTPHFTPTSSSWLNLVERLFAEITRQRIRRGTFTGVPELEAAITDWIEHRNLNPKPFVWTAKPNAIIAKYRRARAALSNRLQMIELEH